MSSPLPLSGVVLSLPLFRLLSLSFLGGAISRPSRSFWGMAAVVFLQLASGAIAWVVRFQHPWVILLLSAFVPLQCPPIGRVSGFLFPVCVTWSGGFLPDQVPSIEQRVDLDFLGRAATCADFARQRHVQQVASR